MLHFLESVIICEDIYKSGALGLELDSVVRSTSCSGRGQPPPGCPQLSGPPQGFLTYMETKVLTSLHTTSRLPNLILLYNVSWFSSSLRQSPVNLLCRLECPTMPAMTSSFEVLINTRTTKLVNAVNIDEPHGRPQLQAMAVQAPHHQVKSGVYTSSPSQLVLMLHSLFV